jgi:hypothetical protein
MAETTPAQKRLNDAYNDLRSALAKMYPDKAEAARLEIITILVLLKLECRKWAGKSARTPLYRSGAMFEIFDLDAAEIARVMEEATWDITSPTTERELT